jgi:hypothetical protein
MGLTFRRNSDGTMTGTNDATGFTVTLADETEVERLVCQNAGRAWSPPPAPPPPGHFRFALLHVFGAGRFSDPRYDGLKSAPTAGCTPRDWDWFAVECERPGANLLGAVASTVAEVRREHGLLLDDLGIEKVYEWFDDEPGGHGDQLVAQLLLMAAARAEVLGYSTDDLIRFLRVATDGAAGQ